jgi:hypothetical protein
MQVLIDFRLNYLSGREENKVVKKLGWQSD